MSVPLYFGFQRFLEKSKLMAFEKDILVGVFLFKNCPKKFATFFFTN